MSLRPANADDVEVLFIWANDPVTRAQSFSSDPIPWEGHVAWFSRVLADPDRVIWLLEDRGVPVGSIRFDAEGERAVVSVQISPEHRKRGFGHRLVSEASRL